MKKVFNLLVIIMCCNFYCYSQVHFPFKTGDKQSSVLAYWYNCKSDTAVFAGINHKSLLHSSFQIYGPFVADSFYVKAEIFLPGGIKAFENSYLAKKDIKNEEYSVSVVNDYFLLISAVPQLDSNPDKIKITISAPGEQILGKMVYCKYHKLYGHMYDFRGNPLRAFIMIYPDAFQDACGVWSDSDGYYEIYLPERTYNCFYVNDGNYKLSTLEAWAWHMIMDQDQELDFKIGTGEVYNLNAWSNNGGFGSIFISFRPMVLSKDTSYIQEINNKEFKFLDISPDLDIKDITVAINGKQTEIYSMQKYFETGKDRAMPAYLIQVRRLSPCFGKQTIRVEYDKTIKKDGKEIFQNSMGYFQFYVNFFGLSDFN
jgi:hypothetical protein